MPSIFLILRGRVRLGEDRQPLDTTRGDDDLLGDKHVTDVNRILLALAVLMISGGQIQDCHGPRSASGRGSEDSDAGHFFA